MFQEYKFGLSWELLDYTSILPTIDLGPVLSRIQYNITKKMVDKPK